MEFVGIELTLEWGGGGREGSKSTGIQLELIESGQKREWSLIEFDVMQ